MKTRCRVQLLGKAETDLADARRWLLQPGSGVQAHRRYGDIVRALQDLKMHPDRWPIGDHEFRERSAGGYRIIYRITDRDALVIVLRIFGPYQNRSDL